MNNGQTNRPHCTMPNNMEMIMNLAAGEALDETNGTFGNIFPELVFPQLDSDPPFQRDLVPHFEALVCPRLCLCYFVILDRHKLQDLQTVTYKLWILTYKVYV